MKGGTTVLRIRGNKGDVTIDMQKWRDNCE